MFKINRIAYFILVVITIILGILSRKFDIIPNFVGDTLYAVMIYFGMRFIFVSRNNKIAIFFALLFCYCIEFQQIYRADWIVQIRRTSIGHYVLGQGFLWSDLGCYTIGVFVAYLVDSILIKTPNINLK
jgi:hypothetical protein